MADPAGLLPRPYRLVELRWRDARSCNRWIEVEDLPDPAEAVSVGFLIRDDGSAYTLAGTVLYDSATGELEKVSEVIVLPYGMVTKMKTIEPDGEGSHP